VRAARGLLVLAAIVSGAIGGASCGRKAEVRSPYVPVAEVERAYGPLIGAANHPTPDQHGNGERVGIFQAPSGTIWGLPLVVSADRAILVCAPATLHHAKVTGTVSSGSELLGFTNEPTGWRAGTGDLELLLRDADGTVRRQTVHGADFPAGPVCWSPDLPGPVQRLQYYRLAPSRDPASE